MRSIVLSVSSAALLAIAQVSHAQCGTHAAVRAVSMTWGDGPGDVSADTGYVASPVPAVASAASWDRSESRGAQGIMNATMTAESGRILFEANGSAQTTSAGMFLSTTGNATFSDRLTVVSDSLPMGAPVSIRYTVTISGGALVIDLAPQVNISATLGPCVSQGQSGLGSISQTCSHAVGHSFPIYGIFDVSLGAGSISGFGPISSTIAATIEARWTIEVLTPGARIVACSGEPYGCPADFTGDGFLDGFDYDSFVACFEGEPCPPGKSADFNGDGFADGFDYDDFVAAFEAGC